MAPKRKKTTAKGRSAKKRKADSVPVPVDGDGIEPTESHEQDEPATVEKSSRLGSKRTLDKDHGLKECLKSYPKALKLANDDEGPLHVNRRGIVPPHADSDKPVFTASEIIEQRHLGLSFKQIGRKLGIDPHKADVLQVYKALDIDAEAIDAPSKVSPPTPLWYLFQSEKEVISDNIFAASADILQLRPHDKVVDRLGDNAGFMLGVYIEVSRVMNEEIDHAISGASPKSRVGQLKLWNGELPAEILHKVAVIQQDVASAAYHTTNYSNPEVGRCMCSALKILRFGWHQDPIPHPSFFWGCSRYTPVEASKHDKGIPVRNTLWDVINSDAKVAHMSEKDIKILSQKLSASLTFWEQQTDNIDEIIEKHSNNIYGGPSKATSKEQVIEVLTQLIEELQGLLGDRDDVAEYTKKKTHGHKNKN